MEIVTLQTGLGDGDRRPVKCSLNDPVREFAPRRQGEPGEPAHAHECCVVFNDFASKALRVRRRAGLRVRGETWRWMRGALRA